MSTYKSKLESQVSRLRRTKYFDESMFKALVSSGCSVRPSRGMSPRKYSIPYSSPPRALQVDRVPYERGEDMELDSARIHAHGLFLSGVPMYQERVALEDLTIESTMKVADQLMALLPAKGKRDRGKNGKVKNFRFTESDMMGLEFLCDFYGLNATALIRLMLRILVLQVPRVDALAVAEEKGIQGTTTDACEINNGKSLKDYPSLWYGTTETLLALTHGEVAVRHFRFLNYDPVGQNVNTRLNDAFSHYMASTDREERKNAIRRLRDAEENIQPFVSEDPVTFIKERILLDRADEARRNGIYLDLPLRADKASWFPPKAQWMANLRDERRFKDPSLVMMMHKHLEIGSDLSRRERDLLNAGELPQMLCQLYARDHVHSGKKKKGKAPQNGALYPHSLVGSPEGSGELDIPEILDVESKQYNCEEPLYPLIGEEGHDVPLVEPFAEVPIEGKPVFDPVLTEVPEPNLLGASVLRVTNLVAPETDRYIDVMKMSKKEDIRATLDEGLSYDGVSRVLTTKDVTLDIARRDGDKESPLIKEYGSVVDCSTDDLIISISSYSPRPTVMRVNPRTDNLFVFSKQTIGSGRYIYSNTPSPAKREPSLQYMRRMSEEYLKECSFRGAEPLSSVIVLPEQPYPMMWAESPTDIIKVYERGYTPVYRGYVVPIDKVQNALLSIFNMKSCFSSQDDELVNEVMMHGHERDLKERLFTSPWVDAPSGGKYKDTTDRRLTVNYLKQNTHEGYAEFMKDIWSCEDKSLESIDPEEMINKVMRTWDPNYSYEPVEKQEEEFDFM